MKKVWDMLLQHCDCSDIAIRQENRSVTYRHLCCEVEELARRITLAGFSHTYAGIFLSNSIEYIIAYFGALAAGCTVVPIMDKSKPDEVRNAIGLCDVGLLITDEDHYSTIYYDGVLSKTTVLDIKTKTFVRPQRTLVFPIIAKSQIALLLGTSGSTSNPKRAMLTHANLYANTTSIIKSLKFTKADKTLVVLPLMHAATNTSQMLAHILVGAEIVIGPSPFNPKSFCTALEKSVATDTSVVPSMLRLLMDYPDIARYGFHALRLFCFSGAPASRNLIEKAIAIFGKSRIAQLYGQTEASPRLTHYLPEYPVDKLASVGLPIPGVQIRIERDDPESGETQEPGEVLVRGKNVMRGYYKNETATRAAFSDGWLRTGDMGYLDEDGFLYLTGRKSNIIISSGRNIYPEEVEDVLNFMPGIAESRVYGIPNAAYGELPVAEIVLTDKDTAVDPFEVIAFCRDRLANYKVPVSISTVDCIEKTASNKILRRRLIAVK